LHSCWKCAESVQFTVELWIKTNEHCDNKLGIMNVDPVSKLQ